MAGEERKLDLAGLVVAAKSVAIVLGSLGSVAALFYWIGNTIVVARLRAYNLFGVVRYTEEYVTEAGYQFLQDVFTFFSDWRLFLLFVAVTFGVGLTLPVGPWPPRRGQPAEGEGRFTREVRRYRSSRVPYLVFLLVALSASLLLTTDWCVVRLVRNVESQARELAEAAAVFAGADAPLFRERESFPRRTLAQEGYHERLVSRQQPTGPWAADALARLDPDAPEDLAAALGRFQAALDLPEERFRFDGSGGRDEAFARSETYRMLRAIELTGELNRDLAARVTESLDVVRTLLAAHLAEEDLSSLVAVPASYEVANRALAGLRALAASVDASFEPRNGTAERLLALAQGAQPIRFGQFLLSYSFWVLVGVALYLLLNVTRVGSFGYWEIGYYVALGLLFATIAVTLPTAYGRYTFEFKVQRLRNVVVATQDETGKAVQAHLAKLGADRGLYLLGPTKGREVIVGAVTSFSDGAGAPPQIVMLDREVFKLIVVEPVGLEEIPHIIRALQAARQARAEVTAP